jgi:MscS family membrane protein
MARLLARASRGALRPRRCQWVALALRALAVLLIALTSSARAQLLEVAPHADAGVELEEPIARDSPRASISDFLALCRAGDFAGAARYLELTPEQEPSGPTLARRLKAVLDRKAWIELEALSPLPSGNLSDGLLPNTDELGRIKGPDGVAEPLRIVRRKRDGQHWVFSNPTVARIDGWYEELKHRWLLENLPQPLLATGPRALMWWQWLALPLMVGVAWLCAAMLALLSAKLLARVAARSMNSWDDLMVERIKRPLALAWTLGVTYLLLPWLALHAPAEKFVLRLMHTVLLVAIFWAISRFIDISAQVVFRSPWARSHDASRSLVSLSARVAKVAVLAIAVVALLSQLGYPIASVLAGLGVGGLAVALAAQKTVENLFGAFSIGADQPFREGDFVRVDDFQGTVELIGLRSTKFRTAERTIISIPNGKLAEMKIETFAARDRLRLAMIVGLARSTTSKQLRDVMEGIEHALWAQPKLFPNSAVVRFEKFGASSLDLDVSAYFDTRDFAEFQKIRQDVLLELLSAIERAGTSLALPSTNVVLANAPVEVSRPTSHRESVNQQS